MNWKELVITDKRYKDFVILDNPIPFNELFKDKNIEGVVQLHCIEVFQGDLEGFCGVCKWENNTLISVDQDIYHKDMLVYGYSWFTDSNNKTESLDILVKEW